MRKLLLAFALGCCVAGRCIGDLVVYPPGIQFQVNQPQTFEQVIVTMTDNLLSDDLLLIESQTSPQFPGSFGGVQPFVIGYTIEDLDIGTGNNMVNMEFRLQFDQPRSGVLNVGQSTTASQFLTTDGEYGNADFLRWAPLSGQHLIGLSWTGVPEMHPDNPTFTDATEIVWNVHLFSEGQRFNHFGFAIYLDAIPEYRGVPVLMAIVFASLTWRRPRRSQVPTRSQTGDSQVPVFR